MNISTFSPALTLLYVFTLLWILMGVDIKAFSNPQRWLIFSALALLAAANHLLRQFISAAAYAKLLLVCMHLPTFFLFLYIAKRGAVKTAFMILTALVFTTPTVLIGNLVRHVLFKGSLHALLLANLISYALMLLLAYFAFRKGFQYLLIYGNNRLFLLFSVVPTVFYVYVLASVNLDFSELNSLTGYIARLTPSIEVFVFYFMLPYLYRTIREAHIMKSSQDALQQQLASTEEQIALLSETNTQMAVYRHDMRHHFMMLNGLLSDGKLEQASQFTKTVIADLDAITPKKFCENETVNLLCSAFDRKAQRMGIRLEIKAILPKNVPLTDTELCSVISNGLENALRAASQPEVSDKWVEFHATVKQKTIFIQMRNPYAGEVILQNGLPVSRREGHGYGCQSIQTIVSRNGGHCSFEAENGLFALRLSFPLRTVARNQDPK